MLYYRERERQTDRQRTRERERDRERETDRQTERTRERESPQMPGYREHWDSLKDCTGLHSWSLTPGMLRLEAVWHTDFMDGF